MFRVTPIVGPKIVGVGFNKTGTSTLGACFDVLGLGPVCSPELLHQTYRGREGAGSPPSGNPARQQYFDAYPWRSICDEILDYGNYGLALHIAAGFRSFHDRPWGIGRLYQLIDVAYPGSQFILTYRDAELWWRSVEHWLTVTHADDRQKFQRYLKHLNVDRLDKDLFIAAYAARNQAIRAYFSGRSNFLPINFEAGDGWQRLCGFLQVPVPAVPLPHANRQNYSG